MLVASQCTAKKKARFWTTVHSLEQDSSVYTTRDDTSTVSLLDVEAANAHDCTLTCNHPW